MVYHSTRLDATFSALSDPTRRAILARITSGERTISELAVRFDMSLPGVSKHIRVLQSAGLATLRKEGRVRRASFNPNAMRGAHQWMEHFRQFWESELEQLANYLEGHSPQERSWPVNPQKPARSRDSKSAARSARRSGVSSTRGRKRRN